MIDFNKTLRSFFLCIFLIVLFLQNASSLDFGISPEKIQIKGKINEDICSNFSLIGEENLVFTGEITWANEETKTLAEYTFSSEEKNLEAVYPEQTKKGEYTFCIKGSNEGNYSGALLYKIENTSYGVGTWISVYLEKQDSENENETITPLTGKAIEEKINNSEKEIYLLELSTLILLVIFLFILLNKISKKRINTGSPHKFGKRRKTN